MVLLSLAEISASRLFWSCPCSWFFSLNCLFMAGAMHSPFLFPGFRVPEAGCDSSAENWSSEKEFSKSITIYKLWTGPLLLIYNPFATCKCRILNVTKFVATSAKKKATNTRKNEMKTWAMPTVLWLSNATQS